MASRDYIDIVFDGPPSHESGRFVEVEDQNGYSIRAGTWLQDDDPNSGLWRLRLTAYDFDPVQIRAENIQASTITSMTLVGKRKGPKVPLVTWEVLGVLVALTLLIIAAGVFS